MHILLVCLGTAQAQAQPANTAPEAGAPKPAPELAPVAEEAAPQAVQPAPTGPRGNSPRLFLMPVAEVVGSYQMSISYEGSLLEERGILSSAGSIAFGVGELAQFEYRHTSAIGINGGNVPVPTVGMQLKVPFSTKIMPALAVAFRLGINQEEEGAVESATDVYIVAGFKLPLNLDLHLGMRITQAIITFGNEKDDKTDVYPAIGIVSHVSDKTIAVIEVGRAPKFNLTDNMPTISSGVTGRVGLRWHAHPSFSLDASAGYLAQGSGTQADDLLAWDIRLGGEFYVPWGAVLCESISLFCNR